ncbi:heparinase II/III domain-containing protein [Viridibacterium curvum]|uniref:Heparinase II/III-like C-terminal domain-containing protein n=1 Tax=Viridibacterium curvum TaxID=1101404 RepID=A0ABP9QJK4_9RHOO
MHRRDFLSLLPLLAACASAPTVKTTGGAKRRVPRLLATDADFQALATRRKLDADLDRFVMLLLERANSDLRLSLLERKLQGKRLLDVSREFIRRSLLWAFAWRVTGNEVWLDRARREMLNVASFSDWNPSHYLDVAEMTAGLAISYDWLYSALSEEDRRTVRRAIVDKGIAQARHGHKTFDMTNNWGQVCIGGMVLGALAVEDDEPELAADLLAAARTKAFLALDAYRPDGVYPEGPGYWTYGTSYEVLLIAALRGLRNTDWGLLQAPGLLRSAEFYAHAVGPTGKHFNFSDSGEGQELATPFFYLARELKQPGLLAPKRTMIRNKQGLSERFAPLAALWWPTAGNDAPPPLHFAGQGHQPVAIWRSSWTDPNALYFAIKAGGAAHNHAHMDAGSFVLDFDGVRWARDLGMQDYNSLESRGVDLWNMKQDSPRWKVFRLGNAAHSTLMVDLQLHNATGMATLAMPGENEALIDLTPVFLPGQLKRATRQARFESNAVSLQDEIAGAKPGSSVRWAMTTEAAIRIEGQTAVLSIANKSLRVRFTGSAAQLSVQDISRPANPLDVANPNVRQLVVSGTADAAGNWQLGTRFSRE